MASQHPLLRYKLLCLAFKVCHYPFPSVIQMSGLFAYQHADLFSSLCPCLCSFPAWSDISSSVIESKSSFKTQLKNQASLPPFLNSH